MITNTKIGMIEFAGPGSDEKVIHILGKCRHGHTTTTTIPCPEDLAGCPPGTYVAVNEFGRLESVV